MLCTRPLSAEMIVPAGQRDRTPASPFDPASMARLLNLPHLGDGHDAREDGGNVGWLPRRGKKQLEVLSALQCQGKRIMTEVLCNCRRCLIDWNQILSDCRRYPAFSAEMSQIRRQRSEERRVG